MIAGRPEDWLRCDGPRCRTSGGIREAHTGIERVSRDRAIALHAVQGWRKKGGGGGNGGGSTLTSHMHSSSISQFKAVNLCQKGRQSPDTVHPG